MKRKGLSVLAAFLGAIMVIVVIGAFIIDRAQMTDEATERYSIPFQPILMSFDEEYPVTDIVGEAIVLKSGAVTIRGFDITEDAIKIEANSYDDYYVLRLDLSKPFFKDRDIDPKKALVYEEDVEICCGKITEVGKKTYYDPDNNFIYVNMTGNLGIIVKNTVFNVETGYKNAPGAAPYFTDIGCDLEDKDADPYCFVEGTTVVIADSDEGTDGIEDITP